jgi:transcriptional regulator with XRE-family HTH domain/ribosomal protein L37E
MELINQTVSFNTPITTAAALASATSAPTSILPVSMQTSAIGNHGPMKVQSDRDVIRCKTCGMVQYRTRNGNCRRCLHLLTPKLEFLIPTPNVRELPIDDRQPFEKWPNNEMVENIGQRIRQLRESRGITQTQLQARSRVSRSYLSRIESGQMTPSLGTLEKISEPLGVGLNRFFLPGSNAQTLLEDPFIQELRPFLRRLDCEQWQSILKRLTAISDHVSGRNEPVRALARSEPTLIENSGRRIGQLRSVTNRLPDHAVASREART